MTKSVGPVGPKRQKGPNKSNRRKSNRRKSNKRKSNKRKLKRLSKRSYGIPIGVANVMLI